MDFRQVTLVLVLISAIFAPTVVSKTVVATFNANGVTGNITLSQISLGADTTVSVALNGVLNGPNKWHVHTFPITEGCTSAVGHYNPDG